MGEFMREEEAAALKAMASTPALAILIKRLQELRNVAVTPRRPATECWSGEMAFDAGRAAVCDEMLRWIETCLKRQA